LLKTYKTFGERYLKYGTANMDNKDNRNKISNKVEQHCDNKEKLNVDERIKLQKKCTEEVKQQDSPCSSTNYEHNEEARKLWRKSAGHEKQKGESRVRCIEIYVTYLKIWVNIAKQYLYV
jgi:hypothetical protein